VQSLRVDLRLRGSASRRGRWPRRGVAEWSYRFRPSEQGTEFEESWRIRRLVERPGALSEEVLNSMKANTESGDGSRRRGSD